MTAKQAILTSLIWLVIAPAWACKDMANTPLEEVFCKVKAAKPSALPYSLHDFRKNPAKTQRLLLSRPAQKLGIALPPVAVAKPEASAAPEKPKAAIKAAKPESKPVPQKPELPPVVHSAPILNGCNLNGKFIQCTDGKYRLLGNLPNSQLAEGALNQTLKLPPLPDNATDIAVRKAYLVDCYRRYIQQMVAIGLAGSTMSYTKFYHTYVQVEDLGADFRQRLALMFDYLKRDKAAIGVKSHYTDELPTEIGQCSRLSAALLVCDNVKTNWVYAL